MKSKITFKKIDDIMLQAEREALTMLLTEVVKIFNKSKYNQFVMAMGMWSFEADDGSEYASYETNCKKMFKKVEEIFDRYNDAFKMTGNSLWLKKDGGAMFHWTTNIKPEDYQKMTINQIVKKMTTYNPKKRITSA